MNATIEHLLEAHPVTGGAHHFFGYYDKFPWSSDGRYLLALQADFMDRQPGPDDPAMIGVIDTQQENRWQALDTTTAWNWQQGTMLQWLSSDANRKIIYNQRRDNRFVATIRDIFSGETRELPRPIYTVSRDGKWAMSLNFARLHRTRPGYGYSGLPDPYHDEWAPADDGVYSIDLESGACYLILSLAEAANYRAKPSMQGASHWFNHVQVNPDDSRFAMLHRWSGPEDSKWWTRLITVTPDGGDIRIIADHDYASHYDWFGPDEIVAWAAHDRLGRHYYCYKEGSEPQSIIGEGVLTVDGHCSFSPDRKWLLTDTYPDANHMRTLILYHMESSTRIDIGRFYAPPELTGPIRCDLHPRWKQDGRSVCIDSAHTGERQIYVLDVSPVIDAYS